MWNSKRLNIIVFFVLSVTSFCAQSEDYSVVVYDDFGDGVKSEIAFVLGRDKEEKGITDDKGVLVLESSCSRGQRVTAAPVNPLYYEGILDCDPDENNHNIKVTKKYYAANLLKNAENFYAAGNYANAAFLFNEYSARLEKIDPEASVEARIKTYDSFAKAINTPTNIVVYTFDENQNATVLTTEFTNYLVEFQRSSGLNTTNNVDFLTLKSQSQVDVVPGLTRELRVFEKR